MMGMMMGGGGEMPMYREGRIAFLKAELAITDVQTKVWDAYAEALKKNMQSMQDMHKTMMTAADRERRRSSGSMPTSPQWKAGCRR